MYIFNKFNTINIKHCRHNSVVAHLMNSFFVLKMFLMQTECCYLLICRYSGPFGLKECILFSVKSDYRVLMAQDFAICEYWTN